MKERPIPFSGPMVTALLDGRKTQTRRIVKHPIPSDVKSVTPYLNKRGNLVFGWYLGTSEKLGDLTELVNMKCPYGIPGERLWVRETFSGPLFQSDLPEDHQSSKYLTTEYCNYKASGDSCEYVDMDDNIVQKWTPSIFMPRWASRILLEITNVRVERLQEISSKDASAEGLEVTSPYGDNHRFYNGIGGDPVAAYKKVWESINGLGSWDVNPFCWVIDFRRI